MSKLKHHCIRGLAYSWFEFYLKDRKQYVSINVSFGVLGPLIFVININDLNTAIKHCKVHHFADDTKLLHINDSIKNLNKAVTSDF